MEKEFSKKDDFVPEADNRISRREFLELATKTVLAATIFPKIESLRNNLVENPEAEDIGYDEVAKSYIALDQKRAHEVSNKILLREDASPRSICGPLAISILMGWKLNRDGSITKMVGENVGSRRVEGIIPSEMWLGSPLTDMSRYNRAFPSEEYTMYHIEGSIGALNFDNLPEIKSLQPGDFLYLDGGSFTHYLTISRKDKEGKIYSVSNIHEEGSEGMIIDEVMLWDPRTKNGYMRNWAKGVGPEKKTTGRAGFYLWRRDREAEAQASDPIAIEYRDKFLNMMREQKKGEWNIEVYEMGKGELFEWRKNAIYHPASTIKVAVAVATLSVITEKYSEEIAKQGLENFLSSVHVKGDWRDLGKLFDSMVVHSEEVAAEAIAGYCKTIRNISEILRSHGLEDTTYEPRRTSQRDMFKMWRDLFTGDLLSKEAGIYLMKKLATYTPNDDFFIGRIRESFPEAVQWDKRGVILEEITTAQNIGFVQVGDGKNKRLLYVGIVGTSSSAKEASYRELVAYYDKTIDLITEYLIASSNGRRNPFNKKSSGKKV